MRSIRFVMRQHVATTAGAIRSRVVSFHGQTGIVRMAHGASAAALCGQAVHRVFYRKPDAAWPVVLPGPSLEGGLEELPLC